MKITAHVNSIITQTCGVGVVGHFRKGDDWQDSLKTVEVKGGAGWLIASFTSDPNFTREYAEAYKQLKERFHMIHQSPTRKNKRTGRDFFFCLYDTTKKGA